MKDLLNLRVLMLAIAMAAAMPAWSMEDNNRDPWESFNRKVFVFNDTADQYVLRPIAKGYQWVMPDPVESGVRNFFSNLNDIWVVANDLMQFEFSQAGSDSGRFLVNTTLGVAGIFDVASRIGLEKNTQDFGITLAHWGVDSGPFLMVPFFGPYTVRDGTGAIVGGFASVISTQVDHVPTRNTLTAIDLVDRRASLLAAESLITGDRYTFLRDVYLQQRDFLTSDGQVEDTFGDEDFDEWDDEE